MRAYLTILILFVLLFACKNETKNEQQIPFEKMKVVVWQLLKADELYARKSATDSTWRTGKKNVQFYQQIFEFNKVDRTQFYKQMEHLKSRPVEFKELMDSVEELSKREKNKTIPTIKKV
ncbi:MAG: hypothetical protein RIR55_579 [Bacteroidota bacterium]